MRKRKGGSPKDRDSGPGEPSRGPHRTRHGGASPPAAPQPPAAWNRADNRKCAPDATKWSIYCAGVQAVEEVTVGTGGGHGIDHRRPALEVIRGVVDDRSKGRSYHHHLMDYNNDPTTTFADMQSLFSEALKRTSDSTWLAAHGFSVK